VSRFRRLSAQFDDRSSDPADIIPFTKRVKRRLKLNFQQRASERERAREREPERERGGRGGGGEEHLVGALMQLWPTGPDEMVPIRDVTSVRLPRAPY